MEKQLIRKQLRAARNALSEQEQDSAAKAVKDLVTTYISDSSTIACYLANDGEVSLSVTIEELWRLNCKVVLPVMHPFRKGYLNFQRYNADSQLTLNRFNIPEPPISALDTTPIEQIDYVLLPLVGFDSAGNRLGMGGGFYDRTFSNIAFKTKSPLLIGIAHDCQQVSCLNTEKWDIPLDAIITPTKIHKISV